MTTMPDSSTPHDGETPAYIDLWVRIVERSRNLFELNVRSPAGEEKATISPPFDPRDPKFQLARGRSKERPRRTEEWEKAVRSAGSQLFERVFEGPIRSLYRSTEQFGQVRIKLVLEGPEVSALPWEVMYDPDRGEFIAAGAISLGRYIPSESDQQPPPASLPLRVLGVVAPGTDEFPIDAERELRLVESSTGHLWTSRQIEWSWQPGLTLEAFRDRLRDGPWHVLHYIGTPLTERQTGVGFWFQSGDAGKADLIDVDIVATMLRSSGTRLVTMTLPASAVAPDIGVLPTAEALVRRGIAAVVATQFALSDEGTIEFLRSFYDRIVEGVGVDTAVALGRRAMRERLRTPEWAAPVLCSSLGDGLVYQLRQASTPASAPPPSQPTQGTVLEPPLLEPILNNRAFERATAILRRGAAADRTEPTIVAISGDASSGKSHLARRVAQALTDTFPDGVVRVPLSPETTVHQATSEVLAALGEHVDPAADAELTASTLQRVLDERRTVVVLDEVPGSADFGSLEPITPRSNRSALIFVSRDPIQLPDAEHIHLRPVSREDIEELVRRLQARVRTRFALDTVERLLQVPPENIRGQLAELAAMQRTTLEALIYPDGVPAEEVVQDTTSTLEQPLDGGGSGVTTVLTPSAYARAAMANDMVGAKVTDSLDVDGEVRALAWIAADRDIDPPLSIGLFGAWGTGKSTFMKLMQEKIANIASDARVLRHEGEDYPACEYIRQITFNAWHYADANLWASLVTHIFEELAKPGGETGSRREYANLVSQLETTRALREDAEQRKSLAAQERERRIEQLDGVRRDRADTTRSLKQGSVDPELVLRDPELRAVAAQLESKVESPNTLASQPVPTSEAVADWLLTVVGDPDLMRRAFDAIPDEAVRHRLLTILQREDIIAVIGAVARDPSALPDFATTLKTAAINSAADPATLKANLDAFDAAVDQPAVQRTETDKRTTAAVAAIGAGLGDAYRNAAILGSIATDLWSIAGQLRFLGRLALDSIRTNRMLALGGIVALLALLGGAVLVAMNAGAIAGWVTSAVGLVGAIAAFAKIFQKPIRDIRTMLHFAVDAVQLRARRQIDALAAQEQALEREIEQATHDEHEAERDLEDIRQGRRLYRYIEERARAADYKPYLGVIAQVRKDFEKLADLMQDGRTARDDDFARRAADRAAGRPVDETMSPSSPDEGPLPAIDRVILYIDDLDRCPVDRVVMVLEAVHLLLALKLFVVVVGVDPRWLMRSLRQHYAAQLAPSGTPLSSWEGDRAYWNSTPENYLEKIFQVPFSLRPMSQPGYVKLMTSVLGQPQEPGDGIPAMSSPGGVGSQRDGPAASDVVAASPTPDALAAEYQPPPPEGPEAWSEEPAVALPGDLAVDETSESPVLNAGDAIEIDQATVGDEPPTNEVTLKPEPVTFEAAPAELKITKAEFDFIAGLRDFIDTPRSAKRLANTYRLIKVLPTPPDAPIDDDPDAEHKIPLVLLAIVIGYPRPAGDVFRELLEATDKTWPAFRKRVIDARVPPQTRPNAARGAQPRNGSRTVAATTRSAASAARDGRDAPPPAEPEQTIDWERLAAALKDLEAGGALPAPLGPYRSWARLVGRFSFEIGRVTTVETEDDDRGKSPSPPAGSPKESPSF